MCNSTTVIYQYLAVLSMNLLNISCGMAISWSSSSVLILKSFETPINNGVPMTDSQLSWIASLLGLGGLVGTILAGSLADIFGRKFFLLALAFPQLASWMLITVATDATLLYVSRFLAGVCTGGTCVVIPVFTAEISEARIRGKLGSFVSLSINFGILLGFVAGHYLAFFTVPKYALWLSVVSFVTFMFFPESPMFLVKKGKYNEAVKSLQFYRNSRRMSDQKADIFRNELDKLIDTREDRNSDTTITWKDFQYKATRKAFLIGFIIVLMNAFSGVFVMTNYAAYIFTETGSNLSPNVAAICVGLIQLIGTYFSCILVDKIGRKPLVTASAAGTGISLSIFGAFSYLTSLGYETTQFGWIPIASFSSMLFIAACGISSLVTVIISELMPDELRTIGSMMCACVSWSLSFISIFCFPSLILAIGLHGCIFFFAGSCFVGAIVISLFMPETKGKSFDEILQALEK